ncbi:MAG: outer membrane lipoprotein carrier protein LolA [Myxococcota bacterium]
MPSFQRLTAVLAALSALLCGAFVALGEGPAKAQQARRSARDVAALVQSFYDQRRAFEADFDQRQFTKIQNHTQEARGHVTFEKPGKMRWDYDEPNGQVFVSDGGRLTIYQPPEEGESVGQVIEREISEHQLPLAFSFLTGTGRLDNDFTFRLLDAARQSFEGYVLELRPREPTPHYDRVLFFVQLHEAQSGVAPVIHRVLIEDSAGNRNEFTFRNLRLPRDIPDARFRYRPPRNARRVQP